ncbi:MAG TPA: sigma-70 family RNA polymerase sigma factor [Ramlibacter sp.]|nr:sigma-70 family RNA polymerase sigma factor [Ramlibacter sp.]
MAGPDVTLDALKLPVEPGADEASLWERWRKNADDQARALLLEMHLPYARVVAASYYRKRFHDEIEFDDYLQLASLGLIEALGRFDPSGGAQFRTFAARRMHGSILDGLAHLTEKQQQIAARQRMEVQRQEAVRDAALELASAAHAGKTGRPQDQLLHYVAEAGLAFALAWILDGTGMVRAVEGAESLPFYRSNELRELRQRIIDLVNGLPAQEKRVIQGHYFHEHTFEDVAGMLGVSRSRVSQLHRLALGRLRETLRSGPSCDISM